MTSSETDAPLPLLSLPGVVQDLLPAFIATGEGGIPSILNFRLVSSVTKSWVDDLPLINKKRIFSNAEVKLEFGIENIQKFVDAPPQLPLTSLSLTKLNQLIEHEFSPEDSTLWNSFVSFWSPRLESLQVDVLQLPLETRITQLLSSPCLRKLRCSHSIDIYSAELADAQDFTRDLLLLEDLSLPPTLRMSNDQKRQFLTQLSTNQNLKRLVVPLDNSASLDGIKTIIDTRKQDTNFRLCILHDKYMFLDFTDTYVRLVSSVAASSSKIRIVGIHEHKVRYLVEKVGESAARKFFKCIEVIRRMEDGMERLKNYPNLRQVEKLTVTKRNLKVVEFPPNLLQFQFEGDTPPPPNLPKSLTHLTLDGYTSTVKQLLASLDSLSEMCPLLKELVVKWTSSTIKDLGLQQEEGRSKDIRNKFPNLKLLKWHGKFTPEDSPNSSHVILIEGFQLPQLTLKELHVDGELVKGFWPYLSIKLQSKTLAAVIEGVVAKNLLTVEIDNYSVEPAARPLLQTLKSKAADNNANRNEPARPN